MLFLCRLIAVLLFSAGVLRAAEQAKQLVTVNPLPTALSDDFKFRKTKLYFLSETGSASGAAKSKKGGQSKLLKSSAPAAGVERRHRGQIHHLRAPVPAFRRGHPA